MANSALQARTLLDWSTAPGRRLLGRTKGPQPQCCSKLADRGEARDLGGIGHGGPVEQGMLIAPILSHHRKQLRPHAPSSSLGLPSRSHASAPALTQENIEGLPQNYVNRCEAWDIFPGRGSAADSFVLIVAICCGEFSLVPRTFCVCCRTLAVHAA